MDDRIIVEARAPALVGLLDMGRNYPAMALVEVKGLVESAAKIEIETTAVVEE